MKEVEGKPMRPDTKDTLMAWLQSAPQNGKYLFVSSQPFCGYQFAVIKNALPQELAFEVVGKGTNPEANPRAAAVILDALARWIYQEEAELK
jgi:hypothetical protein